jgi:hypothetical protein
LQANYQRLQLRGFFGPGVFIDADIPDDIPEQPTTIEQPAPVELEEIIEQTAPIQEEEKEEEEEEEEENIPIEVIHSRIYIHTYICICPSYVVFYSF